MRAAALLLALLGTVAVHAREPVGYIVGIDGTVLYRARGKGAARTLSPRTDLLRLLYADDHLCSDRGGAVRVQHGFELRTVKAEKNCAPIPAGSKPLPEQVVEALRQYGRIGGRARLTEDAVKRLFNARLFSPANRSSAASRELVIRWMRPEKSCPLTVEITDMDRRVVWRGENIAASAGSIQSDSLKTALAGARSPDDPVRLELKLTGGCAATELVTFELLSEKDELALEEALRYWDARDPALLALLGRASVYAARSLYSEAAVVYDAALAKASDSAALLERTIAAHERTGNVQRRFELVKHYEQVTGRPYDAD